jgi:glycosyltransferase involved in cell wall biosynthesis
MACGLPCVVSSVSEEQVRDGEDGFVVTAEDPARYAARILELLDDEAGARRMGGQARKRTVEQRDAELIADRLAAFLRSVHGSATPEAEAGMGFENGPPPDRLRPTGTP